MTRNPPTLVPNRFSAAAEFGLRVFPVEPGQKVPALPWKEFANRAPTPQELKSWDESLFNVGVICGTPSKVVVLDIDSPEAQAAVDKLGLPRTPRVKTARGYHYYFNRPSCGLRNMTKISGLKLDFRGDGGYAVGSGSIHESGDLYAWDVSPADVPFADLPAAALALLTKRQPIGARPRDAVVAQVDQGGAFEVYLKQALADAVKAVEQAESGSRNDTLFKAGVKLANNVAGAACRWQPFSEQLHDVAIRIGLTSSETDATLASCWTAGALHPTRWMVTSRQWIYLSKHDAFFHKRSGQLLKVVAFNNTFASQHAERGTLSNFLLSKGLITVVHDLDYQPTKADTYIERDDLAWYNTYRPSDVVAATGDPAPFLAFVSYLVPEPLERDHLLKMMAWTVRYPGQKLCHALLLRSREHGIGKSMLLEIWGAMLGESNVRKTTTEEITGQYQGFIKETLLVLVEELGWGFGAAGYNRLKDLITSSTASVNEKFMPVRTWQNFATLVILTNLPTPMLIEDRDRRIFYVDTPALKREPNYYIEFTQWWREHINVIRGFLDTVDLEDFSPHSAPPMTAAKLALITDGRIDLVKDLSACIEERCGIFGRDIVTLAEIEVELGSAMRGKSKSKLREALEQLGAHAFGQQRVPRAGIGGGHWGVDRASLWAIRNANYWKAAGPQARGDEYRRDEGALTALGAWPFQIYHDSEWPDGCPGLHEGELAGQPSLEELDQFGRYLLRLAN